ncbi:MAG: hypothetical protein OEZ68_03850 [Gammaproteobacteria bacterium]|nr:hypothetical protein [Gammaproteobacteria bacterium]MDH5799919.1 hypothetical protein [Gammaproteobacteria bacterium]
MYKKPLLLSSLLLSACSSQTVTQLDGLALPLHISPLQSTAASSDSVDSATSEYHSDKLLHYTSTELSTDGPAPNLDTVNLVLCLLHQTQADKNINKGPYQRVVATGNCRMGEELQANNLNVKIESKRNSAATAQYVSLRTELPQSDLNLSHPQAVNASLAAQIKIEQSANADSPYGIFSMSYEITVDDGLYGGNIGDPREYGIGYVRVRKDTHGQNRLELSSSFGRNTPYTYHARSVVLLNGVKGESGISRSVLQYDYMGLPEELDSIQSFNRNHILSRGNRTPETGICFSNRDGSDTKVLYKLYHAEDGNYRPYEQAEPYPVRQGQSVAVHEHYPLIFRYTHSADNDRTNTSAAGNPHHGSRHTLSYYGEGRLWGLPWDDEEDAHFHLKDGTVLSNEHGQFLVKAVRVTRNLNAVESQQCSSLRRGLDSAAKLDPRQLRPAYTQNGMFKVAEHNE